MTYAVQNASASDCVITLPAVSGKYYVLEQILYSYSGILSLGTGAVKIEFGANTVLDYDIKSDLIGYVVGGQVTNAFQSNVNEIVKITLKGVAGLVGKLSIIYQTI